MYISGPGGSFRGTRLLDNQMVYLIFGEDATIPKGRLENLQAGAIMTLKEK